MLKKNKSHGTWKSPVDVPITTACSINQTDSKALIEHIKATSEAAKILSTTCHFELTEQQCNVLNLDWFQYPQLGYYGSQLLVGSVLVQDQAAILLNTIEPYSRDSLLDAYYERRSSGSESSLQSPVNMDVFQYSYFPQQMMTRLSLARELAISSLRKAFASPNSFILCQRNQPKCFILLRLPVLVVSYVQPEIVHLMYYKLRSVSTNS
ncbi:hypothetical protein G6F56_005392 [Rhizopus delemar]|uniref:Uncharacterized protein n=1 Tax=Rhizopus stolonifer TaxID=4846 RepID=A0A367J9S2_RHIST|nr:hypothetical protein G6F56_005392 [Rhizopus delemar]RCH86678.1 hypothetical protein CU098_008760 [Rhizopus stolonifer]